MVGQGEPGVCYVVLILNNLPELLYCIWSTWDVRNTYILIADEKSPSSCKAFCQLLSDAFENVTYIRGHYGSWGGYSLVSASLSGICAGLEGGHHWQHLFLISGNHVALRDQGTIKRDLIPYKSYLRSERVSRVPRPTDAEFMTYSGVHRRLWGWFEEVPGVKSVMTGVRPGLPEVQFFKGSQWVALSRPACELLSYPHARELATFFSNSFVADETFFHTVVRTLELPENVLSIDTTYHAWDGGRAAGLAESDYRVAMESGLWFARKLPKEVSRGYAANIRRHCGVPELDSFVAQVNASAASGSAITLFDDRISVSTPEFIDEEEAIRRFGWEKTIRVLREVAVPSTILEQSTVGVNESHIELPGQVMSCSPVVGVVRSADGRTAWLTIQLRAKLFSESIASCLLSSEVLRGVIGDTFEPTHLESEWREFFQRKLRTAFVFDIGQLDDADTRLRVKALFALLVEAWAQLGLWRVGNVNVDP